jgi:hypothetical protein
VDAINNGDVPPAFQEELLGRANELVNEVNCERPEPNTTAEDDEDRGNGNRKKDKKEKKKDEGVVTLPPDTTTETIPTDTTGG